MTVFSYHADQYADNLGGAWLFLGWMYNDIQNAEAHWGANQDHAAIDDIITALYRAHGVLTYFIDRYSSAPPYYRLIKLFQLSWEYTMNEPPEFDLTWKAICEACVKNDFEGKEWTIAIIDHMRKLMWDKPFSVQWAASPTGAKT